MGNPHQKVPESSEIWKFILYKSSRTLTSRQAESTLRNLCEKHLKGRYSIEIIDINDDIEAVPAEILVVPTVVRKAPLPERKVIGSLCETDRAVAGLGLEEASL